MILDIMMQDVAPGPESVLTIPQVLYHVCTFLTRRQATSLAMCCKTMRSLYMEFDSFRSKPFRPRLLAACSPSGRLLDIDVLSMQVVTGPPLLKRERKRPRHTRGTPWLTSIAVDPITGDVYAGEYSCSGVLRFSGQTLQCKGVAVSGPEFTGAEGIAFIRGSMYVCTSCSKLVHVEMPTNPPACAALGLPAPSFRTAAVRDVAGDWVSWGMAAGPDGKLYIAADRGYTTRSYRCIPQKRTGCVLVVDPTTVFSPAWTPYCPGRPPPISPAVFSKRPIRRPSGLHFDSAGRLLVTSAENAILILAGPLSERPGEELAIIGLPRPEALPWDVVPLLDGTCIVSKHGPCKGRYRGGCSLHVLGQSQGAFKCVDLASRLCHVNMMCLDL